MDIQKFQEKLGEICELGEKSGKILKPQQIKECFGEMDLDKSQLIKILQYLKLKGITIEGAEVALHTSGEEQETEPEEQETIAKSIAAESIKAKNFTVFFIKITIFFCFI